MDIKSSLETWSLRDEVDGLIHQHLDNAYIRKQFLLLVLDILNVNVVWILTRVAINRIEIGE